MPSLRPSHGLQLLCSLLLLLLFCPAAHAEELTARQIMERQKELHEFASQKSTMVMILVDSKGEKKKRILRSYKKTPHGGLARSLLIFTEPADLEGTSTLAVETEPGQVSQWLYLPASKSMQRVTSSAKSDYFMGTDFTYEDMESDNLDNYDFTQAGDQTVDGQDCWTIEALPRPAKAKESGYSKRIFTVRKDIFFTVRIEFFDRRGRSIKTQTNHDLKNVSGQSWVANKTLVDNTRAKHKTLVGLAALETDIPLDDEIFTESFVSSGRRPQ